MIQLACMFDGGLCILAIIGVPSLLGWLGFKRFCKKGNCEHHDHEH